MDIKKSRSPLGHKIIDVRGKEEGPCLVIFGASHGNEHCGTRAVHQIVEDLSNERLSLQTGRLIMVPVCNLIAFEHNKRFVEHDINRHFFRNTSPKSIEQSYPAPLCDLIDQGDFFLDVHSTTAQTPSFVFDDYQTAENRNFCQHLGVDYIITGWPKFYDDNNDWDSATYARHNNLNGSVVIECGQHTDLLSSKVAYQTILNAGIYLGMFSGHSIEKEPDILEIKEIIYNNQSHGAFIKDWQNLDFIAQGSKVAENYIAQEDMNILLPNKYAAYEEEWFYVCTKKA